MQEFGLIKKKIFTWKHLTIWRPVLSIFPEYSVSAWFLTSPEFLSGSIEVQQLYSWPDLILAEAVCKCQFPVSRPLHSHRFDDALGAFHGHCVPWGWKGSFPGLAKIPLIGTQHAVIELGPMNSKSLWPIRVLIASWSRKIFLPVASSRI